MNTNKKFVNERTNETSTATTKVQTGNSIDKPKRRKPKGKQGGKNTLQDKELESIMKWAKKRTNKPKNELKQFAQNIIKKKKELSFWYS